MFEWLQSKLGTTGAIVVAPILYALLILLVVLFSELPTDTFRYLDM